MATIQTSIMMADNISSSLHNITNALNLTVTAFQDVQNAASHDIDANAFDGIRERLNAATIATAAFQNELESLRPTSIPVEVTPVWNGQNNIEIFQGNGVERYQQEILSANDMLNRLTITQQQISQRASSMQIFPPQAINDINGMDSRIQKLRNQIEQVHNSRIKVVGVQQANAEVEQLRQQLNNAVQIQEQMNSAIDNMDVSSANAAYNQLNSIIDSTERNIRDNINEQRGFNNEIRNGEAAANGLKATLATVAGALNVKAGINFIQKSIDMTNEQIAAEQQLANVLANQGASYQDFARLKETAMNIQATTMYDDTAMVGAATELATYIKDADALQHMMGTVANYAAGMSGGVELSYTQMVDYATQLGKALDGTYDGLKKKGFELTDAQKKVIENGSDMEKALVIDEVISQSWAGLAEQMAQTPQGMMASFKNAFNDIRGNIGARLMPVILKMYTMFQNYMPQIEQLIYSLVPVIEIVIQTIGAIIEVAFAVYEFFADNWSLIAPIILAVAAALLIYNGVLIAYNTIQAVSNGLKALAAIREAAHAAATEMSTGATFAATVAQYGFNAALLACPLTWIIIAIIALIAAIYLGVAAFNKIAGTSISATGIIFGAFAVLAAFLWNLFLGLLELILGVINFLVNPFIDFANFIGNVFTNPVSSVIYLFQGMADTVLALLQKIASALDFVFGSNMADTIAGWRAGLRDMADSLVAEYAPNENYEAVMDNLELSVEGLGLERRTYRNAWDTGYTAGENLDGAIGDMFNPDAFDVPTPSDYVIGNFDGEGFKEIGNDTADIANNTSSLKDYAEEDLKYLRDIAEREAINRFTLAEVNFDMGGVHNTVNNQMDLDGITEYIGDTMMERLEIVAEGVYA